MHLQFSFGGVEKMDTKTAFLLIVGVVLVCGCTGGGTSPGAGTSGQQASDQTGGGQDACDKIADSTTRGHCYTDAAYAAKDAGICEHITDDAERHAFCYQGVAQATKDVKYCRMINYTYEGITLTENCITLVSMQIFEAGLCANQTDPEVLQYCAEETQNAQDRETFIETTKSLCETPALSSTPQCANAMREI
jgi:hypothetical protein